MPTMKLLLVLFLIRYTQQNFFPDQFPSNDTDSFEVLQEQTHGKPWLSNKVLIILIICLSLVIIVTLLTTYLLRDQLKAFVTRMNFIERGSVVHHFHPEILLSSSQQTSSFHPPLPNPSA